MTKSSKAVDSEQALGALLLLVSDQVFRSWNRALRNAKINPRQFSMLAALTEESGISQGELARRLMVTPQSVSESVVNLVDIGLVVRGKIERGRPASLKLTANGKKVFAKANPAVDVWAKTQFAVLSKTERASFAQLLQKQVMPLEPRKR